MRPPPKTSAKPGWPRRAARAVTAATPATAVPNARFGLCRALLLTTSGVPDLRLVDEDLYEKPTLPGRQLSGFERGRALQPSAPEGPNGGGASVQSHSS